MPVKFSRTGTGNADFTWNGRETIPGVKTFSSTIIGDIRSNNTSYFTDICVNQISTPDIAGQVLNIDCSLNVKGNISYKDAGGSQQDLLAIIADLSGKIYDISNAIDSGLEGVATTNDLNDFMKNSNIPFEPYKIYMPNNQINCKRARINNRLTTTGAIWYWYGYQGKLNSGNVCFHACSGPSSSLNNRRIYYAPASGGNGTLAQGGTGTISTPLRIYYST